MLLARNAEGRDEHGRAWNVRRCGRPAVCHSPMYWDDRPSHKSTVDAGLAQTPHMTRK